MSYCIMRVEKRKRKALYGLQIEANRTFADHAKERTRLAKAKIPLEIMRRQAEALPKGYFTFENALKKILARNYISSL